MAKKYREISAKNERLASAAKKSSAANQKKQKKLSGW
jgi:hypothetical protein